MRVANKLTPDPKSKRAEKMLEPTDEVANKLTPDPKSKMAEIMPEHTG